MGNPHLIFFVQDLESIALSILGPIFEKNELFPEKTNVHFCQIINRDNIKVKVWERGAGPTLACGTGACAIHVAAYKLGLCNSQTIVTLPGGNLKIDWSNDDCEVMMSGNAKKGFLRLNVSKLMENNFIYLDNASTTPLSENVLKYK